MALTYTDRRKSLRLSAAVIFRPLMVIASNDFCLGQVHIYIITYTAHVHVGTYIFGFRNTQLIREQGRLHEVLIGGGGDGFIGTKIHIHQKFSFSSNYDHFILKCLKMQNLYTFQEKIQISKLLECRPPRFSKVRGSRPPRPPSGTPLFVSTYTEESSNLGTTPKRVQSLKEAAVRLTVMFTKKHVHKS